ncbi:hypothetical protein MPSEU_000914300 [Mayamaea pseudoterrestris]|nr:hypothetical protein MPSEU_000914300 [Mayamaea pseudoterrestris]
MFVSILLLSYLITLASSFSTSKAIYGVPNSGWTSPHWNWGSAVGTGHDCARISRQRYTTRQARQALIDNLLAGNNEPSDFEEVKLALALFLQKSKWDGSDGGSGGYSEVLAFMAQADRYEAFSENDVAKCAKIFITDMKDRFQLLEPSKDAATAMSRVAGEDNVDCAQRKCCGLVLKAMGFIDNGP